MRFNQIPIYDKEKPLTPTTFMSSHTRYANIRSLNCMQIDEFFLWLVLPPPVVYPVPSVPAVPLMLLLRIFISGSGS